MNASRNMVGVFDTKGKKLALVGGIIILISLLFDISPLGGNIAYYTKWATCGSRPLMHATAPGAGMSWYEETKDFAVGRGYPIYYCNQAEAHAAGLADPCIVPNSDLVTGCYR